MQLISSNSFMKYDFQPALPPTLSQHYVGSVYRFAISVERPVVQYNFTVSSGLLWTDCVYNVNKSESFFACYLYWCHYYPHMPIGKLWIYRLLFVCLFFVRLRISPLRIKLSASNFARRFIGVSGRESHVLGNFASPEA